MTLTLKDKYLKKFIAEHEYDCLAPMVTLADKMLREKTGAGNKFLGWMDLPENYDKEEFDRIKVAAKRIQNDCDAFIVIGMFSDQIHSSWSKITADVSICAKYFFETFH